MRVLQPLCLATGLSMVALSACCSGSSTSQAAHDGGIPARDAATSKDASSRRDAGHPADAADASRRADGADASTPREAGEAGDAGASEDATRVDASALGGAVGIAGASTSQAPGSTSFCALLSDGSVRCWGSDTYGQTGNGPPTSGMTLRATEPTGLASGVTLVAVGDTNAGAVHGSRTLLWGSDSLGQLGNGADASASTPTVIDALAGATSLSLGGEAGCAVIAGSVWCWGASVFGNVGNGATTAQASPVSTGVIGTAVAVSQHACALTAGGGISCWGRDDYGQLGRTTTSTCTTAHVLCDPTPGVAVASGASNLVVGRQFTCAMGTWAAAASDGGAFVGAACWGQNTIAQLGSGGSDDLVHTAPQPVLYLDAEPIALAAGGDFACALESNAEVQCWGANDSGQLGSDVRRETVVLPNTPVTGARAIAAGDRSACAVMNDSTVECWGANDQGQLGIGTSDSVAHGPAKVLAN